MKQRDIFLQSEGDAWFSRNRAALNSRSLPDGDPVLMEIVELPFESSGSTKRVLEIGCGDGPRLKWLQQLQGFDCHGIEPSAHAVQVAVERGVAVKQGTADNLPYDDASFDIVIFGFCLYLCDREDLFKIAAEADRVLKNPSWLVIHDFYSPAPLKRAYSHRSGVFSYKMDYRTLFTWHPAYAVYSQKVRHHSNMGYTDDETEWVATSVIRKSLAPGE